MPDQPDRSGKKRVVKNPETFRERAVKAAESEDKPSKRSKVGGGIGRVIKPIFRPFTRFFKWLFNTLPFRIIRRIFRRPMRILGKILYPSFIRSSWHELKLVTWPNWKESRRLTYAVLAFAIVFGAVIAAVDLGLDKIFRNILLK